MIVLQFEHFIYGQFNGVGYRTIKTKHVHEVLTDQSFHELCQLRGSGIQQTLLHRERYVAVTYLGYTLDEWGRRNTWNHTILIPVEDYFSLHPPTLFDACFIREGDVVPEKLEPLRIDTT